MSHNIHFEQVSPWYWNIGKKYSMEIAWKYNGKQVVLWRKSHGERKETEWKNWNKKEWNWWYFFSFHPWWNAGKETTIQHFPLYSHSFVKNELAKMAENSGKTVEKSWTKRMAKVWKLGFYHSMFISLFLCLHEFTAYN